MSASTEALAEGLAIAIEEHGQAFSVDGEEGTFTGVIDDSTASIALSAAGMDESSEITITIERDEWTPVHGATIIYDGEAYTVDKINGRQTHQWRFTATLR